MRTVTWHNKDEGPDPFSGDDIRSELVRKLRRTFEEHLTVGTGTLTPHAAYKALQDSGAGSRLPTKQSFYNAFRLKAWGKTVARCLEAAGVPHEDAVELGDEVDLVRRGEKPGGPGDPHWRRKFADIAARVRDARDDWDRLGPSEPGYRDPELALNVDYLAPAYHSVSVGDLSSEDVAYCLYSALKHGKKDIYTAIMPYCEASGAAAEALLDLIIIPSTGQQVRPIHRAAWIMQRLDPVVREAACQVGDRLTEGRHDGVRELLKAVHEQRVESLLQARLENGFYTPEDAAKVRDLLTKELAKVPTRRGARGLVQTLLDELETDQDETNSTQGG